MPITVALAISRSPLARVGAVSGTGQGEEARMEATITIEQFGQLLQSSDEDNILLRMLRQLQSKTNFEQAQTPPVEGPCMTWCGWH